MNQKLRFMNFIPLCILFILLLIPCLIHLRPVRGASNQGTINNTSEYTNYNTPLPELIKSQKLDSSKLKIHIEKLKYKLSVMYDTKVIKSYPVVFGFNPSDDKLKEGDGCTPEGTFKIISKYNHSSWTKFIWINYPSQDSWRKHNLALKNGAIPASSTIGGEIGIHGVPAGYDYIIDTRQNWTLGCISMKNKDVTEIYPYITKKTIIEITK